jgi:hypothetical protein
MVSLTNEEETLIEALVSCLSIAISESAGVEYTDLNKTKTQKLLYLAINEYDLPVTYCWYLAGSLIESNSVNPSTVESAFDNLPEPEKPSVKEETDDPDDEADFAEESSVEPSTPRPPDVESEIAREFEMTTSENDRLGMPEEQIRTEDDTRFGTDEESMDPSIEISETDSIPDPSAIETPSGVEFPVRDIIDFLKSRLENYPLGSTDEFLLHFYHHHAPERYRNLYESSLHIRSELRSITQQVRNVVHEDETLDGIDRKVERAGDQITELHFNLYEHEELRPTVRAVVNSTDIIEDALMMVEQLSEETVQPAHGEALEKLQILFYSGAWKYPALRIAVETATGPSADRIRQTRERQFESFESELTELREETHETLSAAGLIPSYQDYPVPEEDVVGAGITDLFTLYTSQSDSE